MFNFVSKPFNRNEEEILFTGSYEEAKRFGGIFKRAMNNISPASRQDSFYLVSVDGKTKEEL